MELGVIFLLLLAGLLVVSILIIAGFRHYFMRHMLRGIVYPFVGLALLLAVSAFGFSALKYGLVATETYEVITFILIIGFMVSIATAVLTVLALVCLPSSKFRWLRIILYVIAGILLAQCVWVDGQAVWQICQTQISQRMPPGAMMLSLFLRYLGHVAFVFLLVLVPATRSHQDITASGILFAVSLCLPLSITSYLIMSWVPHFDFEFCIRPLLCLLLCLVAAALWYGIRFLIAFLPRRKDNQARIIGALVAFHFLSICLHTSLVWGAYTRSIRAEDRNFAGFFAPSPRAKLTVCVLNENGMPQANMWVHARMSGRAVVDGQTDTNGLFAAEGICTYSWVDVVVTKDGYYNTSRTYRFPSEWSIKNGRWEPWNPVVTAVVRRVMNPIPMYAKHVMDKLPLTAQPVGYDFMVGDWVVPNRTGKRPDMTFTILTNRHTSAEDVDVSVLIAFPNARDGVEAVMPQNPFKGAKYSWSYKAPTNGYGIHSCVKRAWFLAEFGLGETNSENVSRCYFRIRTVTNAAGDIVQAFYGKMPYFVSLSPQNTDTTTVRFEYYLNPTPNDRNMEFDTSRNIFKDWMGADDP